MRNFIIITLTVISSFLFGQEKPNILIITVDDVGPNSIGCYTHGMQYPTPNIDRIAEKGALFTDYYAQPSCTAGRSAIMMGQFPVRSGLATVGQPGNPLGISEKDPTIAELLKPEGYMTGQFGKNHLGDRNEHLPTVHGFDEFYGNLYHLNASQEPLQYDYPKGEKIKEQFGPRGVIESYATTKDDPTTEGKFGRVGKQKIIRHGLFTQETMQNFDNLITDKSIDFMKRAKEDNKPFFVWYAPSRNHVYINQKESKKHLAADVSYDEDKFGSGLMEHDEYVGRLLDYLEESGQMENTIVIYNTDNGPETSSWPDGGTTMFRGSKMTTYEGGVRSPFLVSWPGHIKPGSKFNGITDGMDIMPTLYAAVTGNTTLVDDLKKGKKIGGKSYKVHLDGYNALDYWTGKTNQSPRKEIFYYYEDRLTAVRYGPWKIHFATSECYPCDMIEHKMIKVYNLRKDPFEYYDGDNGFHMTMKKSWVMQPISALLKQHFETYKEFPPVHGSASLNMNKVIDKMQKILNN